MIKKLGRFISAFFRPSASKSVFVRPEPCGCEARACDFAFCKSATTECKVCRIPLCEVCGKDNLCWRHDERDYHHLTRQEITDRNYQLLNRDSQ